MTGQVWRREADVAVVGSGAAGISVALTAAARGLRVLMVTKDLVGGATPLAQGGLAAALGAGDTPAAHASDTLTAGAGLCEPDVVAALATGAPGAIAWLTGLGAQLETSELRLEGGHSAHRIVHSGDDATGAEVHRALLAALLGSEVEILDRTVALRLLPGDDATTPELSWSRGMDGGGEPVPAPPAASEAGDGRGVAGLLAAAIGADGRLTPGLIAARAVVIAAGGLGQAFGTTSNPAGATGDGIAIAARAGAVIRDLEFVQFHPTLLFLPDASGQCPLITEALRGAGAVLRDLDGTPLMAGHDPRGDLAPRDVVAARMAEVIAAGAAGHVWLDATALGAGPLEQGFPTVTAACRKHGIDPVTAMIPVAPGAHYSCGGILAGLDGRTTLPGLYAVGEAASTGVQGANRLASNSVTEAIIAGRRTGEAIADAVGAGAASVSATASASGSAAAWSAAASVSATAPASGSAAAWSAAASVSATAPASGSAAAWSAAASVSATAPASGSAEASVAAASAPAGGDRRGGAPARGLPGQGLPGQGLPGQGPSRGGASSAAIADVADARRDLAAAMSRWAGVMRDADGLGTLLKEIAGEPESAATVLDPDDLDLDLETVEAANLRAVSLLIAAGALRRAESRGCHRRRDAAERAAAPWHTLLRWDGRELLVTEEEM